MSEGAFLEDAAQQLKNLTVPYFLRPAQLYVRNARILSVADSKPFISYSVAFPVVLVLLGGAFIVLYFWYRKHQQLLTSRRRIAREVARHYTSMPNQDSLSRRKQEHLEALQVVKKMLEDYPSSKVLKSELHNTLTSLYQVEKLLYEAMKNPATVEATRNAYPPIRYTVDLNLQSLSASRHPSTAGSLAECSNRTASPASTSAPSNAKPWSIPLHTKGALAAFHIVDGRVEPAKSPGGEDGSHPLASASQAARTASLELSVMRGFEKRKNENDAGLERTAFKKSRVAGAESGFQAPAPRSKSVSIQADENVIAASARSSLASDAGILGLAFASLLAGNNITGESSLAAEHTEELPTAQEWSQATDQMGMSEVLPNAQESLGAGEPNIFANLHEGTPYLDSCSTPMAGLDEANLCERRLASAEQNSLASEEVLEYCSSRLTGAGSNWDWSSGAPEEIGRWSPLSVVIAEQGHHSSAFAQAEERRLFDLTQTELGSTRTGSCFPNFRKVCYLCGESSMPPTAVEQPSGAGLAEGSSEVVTIQNPLFVPSSGDNDLVSGSDNTMPFFGALEQLFSKGKRLLFATKTAAQGATVSRQELAPQSSAHVYVDTEPQRGREPSIGSFPKGMSLEEGGLAPVRTQTVVQEDGCTCENDVGLVEGGKQVTGFCYDCGKPRVDYLRGHWVCRHCGKRLSRDREFCGCPETEDVQPQAAVGSAGAEHKDCFTQTSLWGSWGPSDIYYPPDELVAQPVSPAAQQEEMVAKKPRGHSGEDVQKSVHEPLRLIEQQRLPHCTTERMQQHHAEVALPAKRGLHSSEAQRKGIVVSTTGSSSLDCAPRSPYRNSPKPSDSGMLSVSDENDYCSSHNSSQTGHQEATTFDDMEDITTSRHPEGVSLMDYATYGESTKVLSGAIDTKAGLGQYAEEPDVGCLDDETPSGHPEGVSLQDYAGIAENNTCTERSLFDVNSRLPQHELSDENNYPAAAAEADEGVDYREKEPSVGTLEEIEDVIVWAAESSASSEHREEVSHIHAEGGEMRKISETRSSSCQTTDTLELLSYLDDELQSDCAAEPSLDTGGMPFLSVPGADRNLEKLNVDICQLERYVDPPTCNNTSVSRESSIQNTDESFDKLQIHHLVPRDDEAASREVIPAKEPSQRAKGKSMEGDTKASVSLVSRIPSGDTPEEVLLTQCGESPQSPSPEEHVSCEEAPLSPDAAKVVLDILEGKLLELGAIACNEDRATNEEHSSSAHQSGEASSELSQVEKLPILEDGTIPAMKILAGPSLISLTESSKMLDFFRKPSVVDFSHVDAGMTCVRNDWQVSAVGDLTSAIPHKYESVNQSRTTKHSSFDGEPSSQQDTRSEERSRPERSNSVSCASEVVPTVAGPCIDPSRSTNADSEEYLAHDSRDEVEPSSNAKFPLEGWASSSGLDRRVGSPKHVEILPPSNMGTAPENGAASRPLPGSVDEHPVLVALPGNDRHVDPMASASERTFVTNVPSTTALSLDHTPVFATATEDARPLPEDVEEKVEVDVPSVRESANGLPDACAASAVQAAVDGQPAVGDSHQAQLSSLVCDKDGQSVLNYFASRFLEDRGNHSKTSESDSTRRVQALLAGERDRDKDMPGLKKEEDAEKLERRRSSTSSAESAIVDLRNAYRRRPRRHRRSEKPIISGGRKVVPISGNPSHFDPGGTSCSMEPHQVYDNMGEAGESEDVGHISPTVRNQLNDQNSATVSGAKEDVESAPQGSKSETPVVDLREVCHRPERCKKLQTAVLPCRTEGKDSCSPVQKQPDTLMHMKQAIREYVDRGQVCTDEEENPSRQDNIIASEVVGNTLVIEQESCITLLDFERPLTGSSRGQRSFAPTTSAPENVSGDDASKIKQKKRLAARKPWKYERKFDMFSSKLALSSKHPPARSEALRKLENDLLEELQRKPPLRCFPTLSRVDLLKLLDEKNSNTGRLLLKKKTSCIPFQNELPRKKKLQQKLSYGNVKL